MNRDRLVALCCAVIGLVIMVGAKRLGLGNFKSPDAGLFPFLIGLIILILSIILFAGTCLKSGKDKEVSQFFGPRWKNLLLLLGFLILYALGLGKLGFVVTTLLFMIVVLKAIEPQKWSVVLAVAIASTSFCYVLFVLWIKVEFPKGIFVGW